MHDEEGDTFVRKSWPEKLAEELGSIGIKAKTNELGTGDVESDEYYGRYFVSTPRMVTNKGSLEITGTNIDAIHIIQKG